MARYKLKLKRLDWISPVDVPAQETARVVLIKRRAVSGFARAVKIDEGLGLVFCWAFTSKANGSSYYDLQGDNVDEDFVRAAAEFMEGGGGTDEMHDGESDGRVVFAMPMTSEIAKAFGVETDTTGLMVALKPSDEVLAKFRSGEYTGVSIEGIGERTKVARKDASGEVADGQATADGDGRAGDAMDAYTKCADCGQYMKADDAACKICGGAPVPLKRARPITRFAVDGSDFLEYGSQIVCAGIGKRAAVHYAADARDRVLKATWSTADIDNLPDSAFLYIEGGGKKDDKGKTAPRSLRHFPYKGADGKIDLPHLRDAIGRIPQSSLPADLRHRLQVKAEKLLAAQHADDKKRFAKRSHLTTAVDGHQHILQHVNSEASGYTDYAPMGSSDTDDGWHCHPWVRNSDDDAFVLGEAAGHTHQVIAQDAIDEFADGDGAEVEGANLDDGGVTKATAISPRTDRVAHGERTSQERTQMADAPKPQTPLEIATAKLADAKETIAKLEKKNKLTDAQRAYYGSLAKGSEARKAFLDMADAEREALVKKANDADEVVYTATNGRVYRKSHDPELVAAIKTADEAQKTANAERTARQDVEVGKRAEAIMKGYPGDAEVHKAVLRAVEGIADEKTRKGAIAALEAGRNAIDRLFKASDHRLRDGFELPKDGAGTTSVDSSPAAQLRKHVEKYQADHKIPTYQQALAKALREDPKAGELYAAAHN